MWRIYDASRKSRAFTIRLSSQDPCFYVRDAMGCKDIWRSQTFNIKAFFSVIVRYTNQMISFMLDLSSSYRSKSETGTFWADLYIYFCVHLCISII